MNRQRKKGFFAWLINLFKTRSKKRNDNTQEMHNDSNEISETIQNSNKMETNINSKTEQVSQKKVKRSFEEIGLLFGLVNKKNEKKTYLDSIDADITTTRHILNNDIDRLKEQFVEIFTATKNIRQELRSLIVDLESNRNSTVIKLSKTIRALLMDSDFDSNEKKEIINKVLDEGMSAVSGVKNSIIQSQKTIDEMINTFHSSSPLVQINTLYENYLKELREHHKAKTELQKGFAAGLAIKTNLDEIEVGYGLQEEE